MSMELQKLGPEDALHAVRKRPELYFPNGKVTPAVLAAAMCSDALFYGAHAVSVSLISQRGFVIACDVDWLSHNKQGMSVEGLFSQMTSNAFEAGPNSIRSEYLIRAFADSLIVIVDSRILLRLGHFDFSPFMKVQSGMLVVVAMVMSLDDIQKYA